MRISWAPFKRHHCRTKGSYSSCCVDGVALCLQQTPVSSTFLMLNGPRGQSSGKHLFLLVPLLLLLPIVEMHAMALPGACVREESCNQGAVDKVPAPREVFGALHHHFLCLADMGLRLVGPEDAQAGAGEQALLAAAVSRNPEAERELCARAMAALYHSHAAAIGARHSLECVAVLCGCSFKLRDFSERPVRTRRHGIRDIYD